MSSRKMLVKGYYDMAIDKSVRKLKKNPAKAKEIMVLSDAYRIANQNDNDRIAFLKKEGRPDIWDEVFSIYSNMKNRQDKVKVLNTGILSKINYSYVNYDNEIISAKQRAAEFFYAHASELMKSNDRMAYRQAHDEFVKVKNFYPTYKDVDSKINESHLKGMSYVIFQMKNATPVPLPPSFESELVKLSLYELNSFWVNYDTRETQNRQYDYAILVNMKTINVTPEKVKQIERTETKKVTDGWEYVLDSKGNVMKDTAGNDVKIQKYKEIKCFVTEYQMHKVAKIAGSLDFLNLQNGQVMKSDPIASEFFFDYAWVEYKGDKEALTPESQKLSVNKPKAFPADFDMLLQSGQILKNMVKDIIWRNKGYFQ